MCDETLHDVTRSEHVMDVYGEATSPWEDASDVVDPGSTPSNGFAGRHGRRPRGGRGHREELVDFVLSDDDGDGLIDTVVVPGETLTVDNGGVLQDEPSSEAGQPDENVAEQTGALTEEPGENVVDEPAEEGPVATEVPFVSKPLEIRSPAIRWTKRATGSCRQPTGSAPRRRSPRWCRSSAAHPPWARSQFEEATVELRSMVERGVTEAKFVLVSPMRTTVLRRIDEVNATIASDNEALRADVSTRNATA